MEKNTSIEKQEQFLENHKKYLSDDILEAIKVAERLSQPEVIPQGKVTITGNGTGNGQSFRNS